MQTKASKGEKSMWIPIEDRVPDDNRYILISFANYSIPTIGRYEGSSKGGNFYDGDNDEPLKKIGLIVNAWQELPEAYRP